MIKVEHTKTYSTPIVDEVYSNGVKKGIRSYSEVLVAEAKLVLVDTKGIGQLMPYHVKPIGYDTYHSPILISKTEKIEVGDWYYESSEHMPDTITQCKIRDNSEYPLDGHKDGNAGFTTIYGSYKILALPEHFSPQQLQMIVDGKLKDGNKVLVECEKYIDPNKTPAQKRIQLNPHITIYPVEEKMYTREEVRQLLMKLPNFYQYSIIQQAEMFEKWFEQNVK